MKKITIGICLLSCVCCLSTVNAMDNIPQTYNTENGPVGLRKNVVLKLLDIIPEENKVRAVIGIGDETYKWKSHPYFLESRADIKKRQKELEETLILTKEIVHDDPTGQKIKAVIEKYIYQIFDTLLKTIHLASRHKTDYKHYLRSLAELKFATKLLSLGLEAEKKTATPCLAEVHVSAGDLWHSMNYRLILAVNRLTTMNNLLKDQGLFRTKKPGASGTDQLIDQS